MTSGRYSHCSLCFFLLLFLNLSTFAVHAATTTTSLAITPGTVVPFRSVVTLTATVTAAGVAVHPGQVLFCVATVLRCSQRTALGSEQLTAAGTATYRTRLTPGSRRVEAIFVGTHTHNSSQSPAQTLLVSTGKAPTSTSIPTLDDATGFYTLTSTVSTGKDSPSGAVSFLGGTALLGTALLGSPRVFFQSNFMHLCCGNPVGIVAGDFNQDGFPDLADVGLVYSPGESGPVSGPVMPMVTVYLGNGDTTMTFHGRFSTGAGPISIAAGDFNGDGFLDLVTTGSDGTITVLLGDGAGDFTTKSSVNAGAGPQSIVVGDFNGDGIPDLAVGHSSGAIAVLLGAGDGTFTLQPGSEAAFKGNFLVVGDFNSDGILDIAASEVSQGNLEVFLGSGDGTFTYKSTSGPILSPGTPLTGDFNRDGYEDVVVPQTTGGAVTVLLGKGDGTFSAQTDFSTGSPGVINTTLSVALGDFDGDGIQDLITSNWYPDPGGQGSFLTGNGDGTFTTHFSPALSMAGHMRPVLTALSWWQLILMVTDCRNSQIPVRRRHAKWPRGGILASRLSLRGLSVRQF